LWLSRWLILTYKKFFLGLGISTFTRFRIHEPASKFLNKYFIFFVVFYVMIISFTILSQLLSSLLSWLLCYIIIITKYIFIPNMS
jgi:hypothetical protein